MKVSHLESLPDVRAKGNEVLFEDVCLKAEYTRTLDKAYIFFGKAIFKMLDHSTYRDLIPVEP